MRFNFLKRKKKVSLVLGGGSARGLAHIGVLKVLEKEKIPIDRVIGTSMGAFVAAGYATGVPTKRMEDRACDFVVNKLLDPTLPRMGLLGGKKLEAIIADILENRSFRDCKIPLSIVTTDIETGEEMVYQDGDLPKLVRASCSWPGIFNPVRIGGRLLVDGGIKNSVPTKIAKTLDGEYMIAVDVGFCVKQGKIENIFQMILQSFQIMGHELNKYQAREADIVIDVDLGDLDQASFHRAKEAIEKGEMAAEKSIAKIKRDLGI
ncbi:MAG: patatin-like phospholipase family protein [Candidatus Omnitrophica bacterium]|nr:patatin-like phospholipase family protein [Candidatus Omnitrophota bacterium]